MRITLTYFAPVLAAIATAATIAVAPIAAAAASGRGAASGNNAGSPSDSSQAAPSCVSLDATQSQCQSPGNAQIYDAPPQVDFFPYGGGAT
jgi:hypothetical protein